MPKLTRALNFHAVHEFGFTHPDNCPLPSAKDEETFHRVFGKCDWSVMAIMACGGKTYARLQFSVGPRVTMPLKVIVDYNRPFAGSNESAWLREYDDRVHDRPAQFVGLREQLLHTDALCQSDNACLLEEVYDYYF